MSLGIGFKNQFLARVKEKEDNEKLELVKSQITNEMFDSNVKNNEVETYTNKQYEITNTLKTENNDKNEKTLNNVNTSSYLISFPNDSNQVLVKPTTKNMFENLNSKSIENNNNKNNLNTSKKFESSDTIEKKNEEKGLKGSKSINNSSYFETKKTFVEDIERKNSYNEIKLIKTKKFNDLEHNSSLTNIHPEDNRKLIKKDKICDSDTDEEGSDNEKEVSWVIMPENQLKRAFDIIIAFIIAYSSIVLPYKIAFVDDEDPSDVYTDNIMNGFLALDIIFSFFSAYVDEEDNVIKNPKKIVKNYLKGWFIVDFVSVIPISYLIQSSSSNQFNVLARLGRIPKLYRLVRLTKLFRMVKILKKGNVDRVTKFLLEKLKVNANIERLIYFILCFLLLNHLAACIWYFMAKLQEFNPDCWVTRLGFIDSANIEIYIVSFYWTLTTVTTVGYGDVNAGTTVERIYNLFIMSFGVLMYSFAIGSLSLIVSTLDAKTAEMNQKLQILSSIKQEFSLDQDTYEKVRKVIKYDLFRNQKDKMNFLQELPNKLRIELSQIMHDSIIQKMYFFRDQPSDLIAYVAPLLKPVKFSQNDYLYKEGDMIDEMYFISKGTVSLCLDRHYLNREIKEVKKHNNFGEIEMCLNEKLTYNIKVKSRNCELFVLKKNDFLRLSVNFKEFIEKFLQKSLLIYLRFNDEKKKIEKVFEEHNRIVPTHKESFKKGGGGEDLEIVDEEDGSDYDIFADADNTSGDKDISLKEEENESEMKSESEIENEELNNSNIKKDDSVNIEANSLRKEIPKSINLGTAANEKDSNYDFLNIFSSGRNSSQPYKNSKDSSQLLNNKGLNSNNLLPSNLLAVNTMGLLEENELGVNVQESSIINHMNTKFLKKVEKIIDFFIKNNIETGFSQDDPDNPINMLRQLISLKDLSERNELIDKLEASITEILLR